MPKKKSPKIKSVKKISKNKTQNKNNILEQMMNHFEKEVETLGRKFEKNIDKECEKCDGWFDKTFGIVGPLMSGIFGLLIFAFGILSLHFINLHIKSNILSGIYLFLLTNIGLFFLFFFYLFLSLTHILRNCFMSFLI